MKRTLYIFLIVWLVGSAVSAQTTLDIEAARNAILNGVTTIHSGQQPGYMVVYGDNAGPISWFPDGSAEGATIAVAEWGNGRVLAMPDHQMLNMGSHGNDGTTGQFYKNGLAWVTDSTSQNINIITYDQDTADWLNANGYPNATATNADNLSSALGSADVFVGWLGSSQSQANLDALATFVQNGGGLMLAEYGAGYTFWWTNSPVYDAPGNRLLRDVGIGFTADNSFLSGLINVNRANVTITLSEYYAVMADQSAYSSEQVGAALQLLDGISDTLPPSDPLPGQMAAVFVSNVRATINNPVTDPNDKATLSAEMDILSQLPPNQVTAHPTAEELYGAIPAGAPRLTGQSVTIDTSVSRWHSTGLYVVPGEVVQVTVPNAVINEGFRVLVSGHGDNISPRDEWWRVPFGVQRAFDLDTTTIDIANAFGGAIYINVGSTPPADNGVASFDVTIDNAIAAPYFVLGETTNADWIASIRDNPAPYAEFVSDRIAFSVPSSSIRNLDEAEELLQLWDDVVAMQDYAGGLEHLRTMPERINIDVQISVGLLHAGYPIQGPTYTVDGMTDYDAILSEGSWGYYHELGHEMQRRPDKLWGGWINPYTFDGDVEVTVNIFSNIALETLNPGNPTAGWGWSAYPDLVMDRAITSVNGGGNFDSKDPYPFYYQLADGFGWDAYREVFGTYNDDVLNNPGAIPTSNIDKKTEWLMRWSEAVNYDMRCYMVDVWGLTVSLTGAETAILDALPCWLPVLGNTADQALEVGDTATLNFQTDAQAINNQATVTSVSAPNNGTLQDNGNGSYTYTPSAAGTETVVYTLQSSVGNTEQFSVTITTTAPLVCPNALVVVSTADSGACTLRTAIENASAGDTISFDGSLAGQTITLNSALIVDKELTIEGDGMTLSGGNSTDIFDVSDGILFTLKNANVVDGRSDSGAMIVRWNATALIQNSTFANNHTTFYDGGAIHSQGRLIISNSTFSGNTGVSGAASVFGLRGEGHEFINITVADNQSPNAAAIQSNDGTVAAVYNSIIANNSLDCSGVPFSGGTNNWFGDASCNGTAQGDPLLSALQDNGGLTLTHMPLAGSPVIDAGQTQVCIVTDQIGNVRDNCDIGAVESQAAATLAITLSSESVYTTSYSITA